MRIENQKATVAALFVKVDAEQAVRQRATANHDGRALLVKVARELPRVLRNLGARRYKHCFRRHLQSQIIIIIITEPKDE
jgi:hypothetical protein